jgi:hypothetical protein
MEFTYSYRDGQWFISSKAGTWTIQQWVDHVTEFFKSKNYSYDNHILITKHLKNLLGCAFYETVAKNEKTGKIDHAPSFVKSWVTIVLDYMQSTLYTQNREELINNGLDPKTNNGQKEIDKVTSQLLKDFSTHLSGKPNMFLGNTR